MIGGLQYLTHTSPNIQHSVGMVARFQAEPRESHYVSIKRILRYLRCTMDYGLRYENSDDFTLCAYTNVDWGDSVDDKKSTNGGAFFLGGRLVSWLSKKKNCISQSIVEAEYVAETNNCNQIIWMEQMLMDIGIKFDEPIVIYCDNTSIVSMSKNLVLHSKIKHIEIKYHVVREKVVEKEVRLEYISTKEQIADIFTKPLPKDTFEYLRGMLGVMPQPTFE